MISATDRESIRQMLATNAGIAFLRMLAEERASLTVHFDQVSRANATQGTRLAEQSVTFGRMSAVEDLVNELEEIRDGQAPK